MVFPSSVNNTTHHPETQACKLESLAGHLSMDWQPSLPSTKDMPSLNPSLEQHVPSMSAQATLPAPPAPLNLANIQSFSAHEIGTCKSVLFHILQGLPAQNQNTIPKFPLRLSAVEPCLTITPSEAPWAPREFSHLSLSKGAWPSQVLN